MILNSGWKSGGGGGLGGGGFGGSSGLKLTQLNDEFEK